MVNEAIVNVILMNHFIVFFFFFSCLPLPCSMTGLSSCFNRHCIGIIINDVVISLTQMIMELSYILPNSTGISNSKSFYNKIFYWNSLDFSPTIPSGMGRFQVQDRFQWTRPLCTDLTNAKKFGDFYSTWYFTLGKKCACFFYCKV